MGLWGQRETDAPKLLSSGLEARNTRNGLQGAARGQRLLTAPEKKKRVL